MPTVNRWITASCCWLVCYFAPSAILAQENETTRVALVTLGQESHVVAAVELATASLSQEDNIELLEREHIQAVLREQSISISQEGFYRDLLRVGQLLRADVFVTLAPASDSKRQRCVILEAATGCRLYDATLPETAAPELAKSVMHATKEAITKRRLLKTDNAQLVAFHGWRNVDLSPGHEPKLLAIRELLEQRINSETDLIVLERARLRVVNDENRLPTSRRQARLLASALYIVPQFSLSANKADIELTLVLHNAAVQDQDAVRAVLPRGQEAEAIGSLVKALEKTISVAPRTPLLQNDVERNDQEQLLREAKWLHAEAKRLQKAGEGSDATAFYEASFAVDSSHTDSLKILIGLLDERSHALLKPIRSFSRKQEYRPEDHYERWHEAFDLLEYRLDLIVLQHGKQKRLDRWPENVTRGHGGGGWPPWHEGEYSFDLIDHEKTPELHRRAKAYCDRYLTIIYGEIAEYARQQCKTNHALNTAIEMSHSRRNHQVARISGCWPELVFKEFDRWESVLLSDRWENTRHEYATPVNRLLDLIEFKDYERHAVEDSYAKAIRERVQRIADSFPVVEIRTGLRLLDLDKKYFGLQQPELIAKRVEPLIAKAFARATRTLPEDAKRSHFMFPGNGGPKPVDQRRKSAIGLLLGAVDRHPNSTQVTRDVYEQLLDAGVFSPAFMRSTISKSEKPTEDIGAWLGACESTRKRIHRRRARYSATDYQQAMNYLTWRVGELQSMAERHKKRGVMFWSKLCLIEGKPKWPQSNAERQELQLVGHHLRGQTLYYLVSLPSDKKSHGKTRRNWQLKKLSLDGSFEPKLVSTIRDVPHLGDLAPEQRKIWETMSRTSAPHTRCRFAADKQNFYAAHSGFGISVVPLHGGMPWMLDESLGLPSNFIHSIVVAQDRLYAWVGRPKKEMLLVAIAPEWRDVEVLISSERVDKANPFGVAQPEVVSFLYYDAPRNRLLFLADHKLWQFNLETKLASPWIELTRSGTVGHPDCGLSVDSILVANNSQELLVNRGRAYWSIDLATGTHRRMPSKGSIMQYPGGNPCAWRGDYLWLDSTWQAYDPSTNRSFPLQQPFPEQDLPPFYASRICEVDDQAQYAVVRDSHHLWIAELLDPKLVKMTSITTAISKEEQ